MAVAACFYLDILGFAQDPRMGILHEDGTVYIHNILWANAGLNQIHLPLTSRGRGGAKNNIYRGRIGINVPSLKELANRLTRGQNNSLLYDTHFQWNKERDEQKHEIIVIRCPFGNKFVAQEQNNISQVECTQIAFHPGVPSWSLGIPWVEIYCRPGTIDGIGRYFDIFFGAAVETHHGSSRLGDGGLDTAVSIITGPQQRLRFVETEEVALYPSAMPYHLASHGFHLAMYLHDHATVLSRLHRSNLLWGNPRFLKLDQSLGTTQFRCKDIVDPNDLSGPILLELEMEVRSLDHHQCPLHSKVPYTIEKREKLSSKTIASVTDQYEDDWNALSHAINVNTEGFVPHPQILINNPTLPSPQKDLFTQPASKIIDQLRSGSITPEQLLDVLENRIHELDGTNINALPFALRRMKHARAAAKAILPSLEHYRQFPKQVPKGYLWGLPVVVKDTVAVADFPFTQGSLLLGFNNIPEKNHALVNAIVRRGGILYAKSNVPEFAAGSNTFNVLFGITASPYDTTRTSGGSSGGSAAALSSGMCWLATGSDLGGSLRIPAAFCGCVGFRPSPGLIPGDSPAYGQLHSLNGPMGRNVCDVAILMDAMSFDRPDGKTYRQSLIETSSNEHTKCHIVFSKDVGGTCKGMMDPEIVDMCRDVAHTVQYALRGHATPLDTTSMDKIFQGIDAPLLFEKLRSLRMWKHWKGAHTESEEATKAWLTNNMEACRCKPEFVWNCWQGSLYTSENAFDQHSVLLSNVKLFFDQRTRAPKYILTPTTCSVPFDKQIRYLTHVSTTDNNNSPLRSYVEWLRPTYVTTLLNCPVISIPIGVTESGLPVGISIIGKAGSDCELLMFASFIETLLDVKKGCGVVMTPFSEVHNHDDDLLDGPRSRKDALLHHAKILPELNKYNVGEEPVYSDPQGYSLKKKCSNL